MAESKIAILTDSCADVPQEYVARYQMYVVPLLIRYQDGEYRDKIDIRPEQVYARFHEEIPKTSLPGAEEIAAQFQRIVDDGYRQAVIISISSGLSGTANMLRLVAKDFPMLDCRLIDTKNIAIGAGFTAIRAGELIEAGRSLDQLERELLALVSRTKVFFCVSTLEYLKKGGRIGFVTATLGEIFDLKPVITCNADGVYHTVHKARGRKRALKDAVALAVDYVKGHTAYRLAVMHGDAEAEAELLLQTLRGLLPTPQLIVTGQISPALVVHTGPGLVGVGVQCV